MQVKFEKIGEIDTAKETFWASVVVKAKWREETFDGNQVHIVMPMFAHNISYRSTP